MRDMTLQGLKEKLLNMKEEGGDIEENHILADQLLLEYIGDEELKQIWSWIPKYYA